MHNCHQHTFFGGRGRHGHFGGKGGFFGRFGGGQGGAGIRAAKMLASGDLQLIILAFLREKPRHGYEIIKALEEHSSGVYTPSPGMVYPAMTYLEEMGFADASTEGAKKLYTITQLGSEHLAKNRSNVDETLDQLARFGRKLSQMQKQFSEEEDDVSDFARERGRGFGRGGDKTEAASGGGNPREDMRALRSEFREIRDELKAAIFEKFSASLDEKKRVLAILRRAIDEIRGK